MLYLMRYILQEGHIGGVLRCLSAIFFQVNECFVFMDLSFMKQRYVWLLVAANGSDCSSKKYGIVLVYLLCLTR